MVWAESSAQRARHGGIKNNVILEGMCVQPLTQGWVRIVRLCPWAAHFIDLAYAVADCECDGRMAATNVPKCKETYYIKLHYMNVSV